MKVKCIKEYQDLQLDRLIKVDEIIDVTEDRAQELSGINNKAGCKLVEIIEKTQDKPVKKRTGRKKEAGE